MVFSTKEEAIEHYKQKMLKPVCSHTWADWMDGLAEDCPIRPHWYESDRIYAQELLHGLTT